LSLYLEISEVIMFLSFPKSFIGNPVSYLFFEERSILKMWRSIITLVATAILVMAIVVLGMAQTRKPLSSEAQANGASALGRGNEGTQPNVEPEEQAIQDTPSPLGGRELAPYLIRRRIYEQ